MMKILFKLIIVNIWILNANNSIDLAEQNMIFYNSTPVVIVEYNINTTESYLKQRAINVGPITGFLNEFLKCDLNQLKKYLDSCCIIEKISIFIENKETVKGISFSIYQNKIGIKSHLIFIFQNDISFKGNKFEQKNIQNTINQLLNKSIRTNYIVPYGEPAVIPEGDVNTDTINKFHNLFKDNQPSK